VIREEFRQQVGEFEEILQRLATDIASGVLFERLQPQELWNKTKDSATRLMELTESLRGLMLILKPEKAPAIEQHFKKVSQALTTFKDILFQKSPDPFANSRLAFEQLRKAIADGSDFLVLMREVKENPSKLIDAVLRLREASEAKGPVITIQAPREIQPVLARLVQRLEALRASIMAAEKALGEAKEQIRNLQEESLKFGGAEPSGETAEEEAEVEKSSQGQQPLSRFEHEGRG